MADQKSKEQSSSKYNYIGTSSIRPDGVEKVTGKANYGADFSLPGMLHGKGVCSSNGVHARCTYENNEQFSYDEIQGNET